MPVRAFRPQVPQNAYEPGMTDSQLATDAASGAVVLSGVTNSGQGGVYVQQVLPSLGSKVVLPLASSLNDWNSSISGRIGGPGVYVAYADGKAARLYRYGGGLEDARSRRVRVSRRLSRARTAGSGSPGAGRRRACS